MGLSFFIVKILKVIFQKYLKVIFQQCIINYIIAINVIEEVQHEYKH